MKTWTYYLIWLIPADWKLINAANETQSHHYSFFSLCYSSFKLILSKLFMLFLHGTLGQSGPFCTLHDQPLLISTHFHADTAFTEATGAALIITTHAGR